MPSLFFLLHLQTEWSNSNIILLYNPYLISITKMSQLIHLKQRIKSIAVIKKITHAMRLISMSSHSKLKKHVESLHAYKNHLLPILCALEQHTTSEEESSRKLKKTAYIIIGSEKGLCGNFNNLLFSYVESSLSPSQLSPATVITIGKRATDFMRKKDIKLYNFYNKFTQSKIDAIAENLYQDVLALKKDHHDIIFLYNFPRTFFFQEPVQEILIPVKDYACTASPILNIDEYYWPQDKKDVSKAIFNNLIKLNILKILCQSIMAEQSARFISMDSSTKNADNLLKSMSLLYNKLRQAKITKELAELSSSF